MNQRKPNRIVWYSLGLVLLLCSAALVLSTGTAFARYRSELEKGVTFEVREMEQIHLGSTTNDEAGNLVFSTASPKWIKGQENVQMDLAVANGTAPQEHEYSQRDQQICLQLIGSVGLWDGEDAAKIVLTQKDGQTFQATATPITKDTALYHTHGAGWIYTFQDAEGEELSWTLHGGELSFVCLTITVKDTELTTDVLLIPQVIGR